MKIGQLNHKLIGFFVLLLLFNTGCTLQPQGHKSLSTALSASQASATRLGQAVALQAHPDTQLSGIYSLANPRDAFAARALLARAAEQTLDVQYYIWHKDTTGTLLLEELYLAAERGVRVRLLLDDNGTSGLDSELIWLNQHPNIEVRLFNPFKVRSFKPLGYLTDFSRMNRRMHNKSFTADNAATIIGGRNIGDEYFGATDWILFADLDVLGIGPIVNDVSQDFDRYWKSDSAFPITWVARDISEEKSQQLRSQVRTVERSTAAADYLTAIKNLPFINQLFNNELSFTWAKTYMVSDDPAKGLGLAAKEDFLLARLAELGGSASQEIALISPYFVPTKEGVEAFTQLVKQGVQVKVLTNSLDATDVVPVHAGYAKRRKALLENHIELFEMRRTAPKGELEWANLFGSSGSSLHAKTFAIDRERVFVGSFNFDPRSANLNTELGFVIESPAMANAVAEIFEQDIYKVSYRVLLDPQGKLQWQEQLDNEIIIYHQEPNTPWYKRAFVKFCSWLPIEPLL